MPSRAGTAMGRWSWVVLLGLAGWVSVQPTGGCHPAEEAATAAGAAELLRDVGPQVVLPTLARFEASLDDLEAAAQAWSDADGAATERDAVRDAFAASADIWQELEMMQVGPAASSAAGTDPAAEDLRDEIYSWPTVNPCRVDQETVREAFRDGDFFDVNLVNAYGLDALEHLLYAGENNVCPGQVDINSDGTWNALGADGVAANRAEFATVVVSGVRASTEALQEAWSAEGDDFGDLLSLGEGSPYADEHAALNAVYDALFYVETFTKDRKLAEPLGQRNCQENCGEQAEGVPSGSSTRWIAANLRGFRRLFTGGEGQGFDDLLTTMGHGDLAERILTNTDAALAQTESAQLAINEYVASDPGQVEQLLNAVRLVTDDVKGDLATVLSLRLPLSAAGDND